MTADEETTLLVRRALAIFGGTEMPACCPVCGRVQRDAEVVLVECAGCGTPWGAS